MHRPSKLAPRTPKKTVTDRDGRSARPAGSRSIGGMDPDQLAAFVAAAGSVLAALGVRHRKGALDRGRGTTLGLALARVGTGAARVAGNVTGTTGRVAADTAAAGIRVVGATVAHSA